MRTTNAAEHSSWSKRPVFRPRQMLTAHQLNAGLKDELMRQQLLNRAVHGYGVVVGYGLVVRRRRMPGPRSGGCLEAEGRARPGPARAHAPLEGRPYRAVRHRRHAPGPRRAHYTLSVHFAAHPPRGRRLPPVRRRAGAVAERGCGLHAAAGCQPVDRRCPTHPAGACVGHSRLPVPPHRCSTPGPDPGNVAGEPGRRLGARRAR